MKNIEIRTELNGLELLIADWLSDHLPFVRRPGQVAYYVREFLENDLLGLDICEDEDAYSAKAIANRTHPETE